MGITREVVPDLNIQYGIDAGEELTRILNEELSKVLAITEDNLKEEGWEEGNSPSSGKKVWVKIIFDENKLYPLSVYEYDFEEGKLTHNGHSMSVLTMSDIKFYMLCREDL
jgi:hypothetical protein